MHKAGYFHPFRSRGELNVVHPREGLRKSVVALPQLEGGFSSDSESMLYFDGESLKKAIYHFDIETPEGIDKLLQLLPILDGEIIEEVYQEIWPGYPTEDDFNLRIARAEIRGYLMDFLLKHDVTPGEEKPDNVVIEATPEDSQEMDQETAEEVPGSDGPPD